MGEKDPTEREQVKGMLVVGDEEDVNPFRHCDRILNEGTIVTVGGVEVKFLIDVPVECVAFRDEQVFVEHLVAEHPANLGANQRGLAARYNHNGCLLPDLPPDEPEVIAEDPPSTS